jgi:hypothetical protein
MDEAGHERGGGTTVMVNGQYRMDPTLIAMAPLEVDD